MSFRGTFGTTAALIVGAVGVHHCATTDSSGSNAQKWGEGATEGALDIIEGILDALLKATDGGNAYITQPTENGTLEISGYIDENGQEMFIQEDGTFSNTFSGITVPTEYLDRSRRIVSSDTPQIG